MHPTSIVRAPFGMVRALLCLALAVSLALHARAEDERVRVVVLHTNDIHGQVLTRPATWLKRTPAPECGGLPRVAAYVNKVRAESAASGAVLLVVDAGDWYQGTPEGLVGDGRGFVRALGRVGYDALCIGNHEFDNGLPNLRALLELPGVDAVAANLLEPATHAPVEWVPAYRSLERGGLRIALVGLVTPVTPEITHADARTLEFQDPVQAFERVEKELAGKVDWILPLTHLGVEGDRALARANPELGLIVGGHSHTFLKEGAREGDTLIVQAGTKASCVGRVELVFDKRTKRVLEAQARLVDLLDEPAAADKCQPVDELCAELAAKGAERMGQVVGELLEPLRRAKDPLASSPAGNWIADTLRKHTRADVGLMNRGGIRVDLEAGPVTRRHVFELVPFENNVTVLKLTGADLQRMLATAVEGSAHSGIELSGARVFVAVDEHEKRALVGVEVGGAPLDPERVYRVAMNSFMADGGDAYISKVAPGDKRTDELLLMRDLLEAAFVEQKQVRPPADDRYVVKRP